MRITKDPEVRKQEIVDTAKKLFEQKGIKKTSINEVAESIGVAKGLVYYYFASKEDLVRAVVEDFIQGVDEALTVIMDRSDLDFIQKLNGILDLYLNSIQKHPAIAAYSPGDPELFTLIRNELSDVAFKHAKDLALFGAELGIIDIKYPEYMVKVIIRGLGDLYIEGVRDQEVFTTLIEQMIGLDSGSLAGLGALAKG